MNTLSAEEFYHDYDMFKLALAYKNLTSHEKEHYKVEAIQTILYEYDIQLAESDYQKLRSWIDNRDCVQSFVFTNKMLSDIFK